MEELLYVSIFVAIIVISSFAVHLKNKLDITENHLDLFMVVLDVVDFVNARIETRGQKHISLVVEYIIEAYEFVEEFEGVLTPIEKKQLVTEKTEELMELQDLEMSDEKLKEIIDIVIEYIFSLKKI